MIRCVLLTLSGLFLCPLLVAQQFTQVTLPSNNAQPAPTVQATEAPLTSIDIDRARLLKKARTIKVYSNTAFLTNDTLFRAMMKQKDWDKLGLSIVGEDNSADLAIYVDRLIFTHIHTFVLSDKKTSVVLATGKVRSFDGIVASGDMAKQIVKILSDARLSPAPKGL
jgi:hypothetical protein